MRRFRRKSVIWAASLEAGDQVFECIILDLSSAGARLKVSDTIPLDQPAVLAFGNFGRFPCVIVRAQTGEAGIKFSDPPDLVTARLGEVLPLSKGS